ncbi:hypothetical protein L9F63_022523, partial [Diploptera punctata]
MSSLPIMYTVTFMMLALLHGATSYSSGGPESTCSSLVPGHKATAQTSAPPFEVIPSKQTVAPGARITLMIRSPIGAQFKGLMLQARNGEGSDSALGHFTSFPTDTKAVKCPGGNLNAPNTATHENANLKTSLQFEWEAPDYYEGPIVFYATIVQNYSTFWTSVKSDIVQVTKHAADNSSQSTGISTTRKPILTTTVTNPPYVAPGDRRASISVDTFYNGCGTEKTCFGDKEGCVESRDCNAVVSCLVKAEVYEFEMKTNKPGYVAVGLSRDAKMMRYSVVECVRSPSNPTNVQPFMSWNTGYKNKRSLVQDGITLKNSSYVNGVIYCKFVRDPVTTVEGETFDLINDKYHLLIAAGANVGDNNLNYHDVREASQEKRSLADVGIIAGASELFVKLHGAFMIAAWIGTAGVGILLARYYKQTWVGSQLCGKDQWFAWHRMFMLLTWALTIAAFVLIFLELQAWSEADNPHAILGCVTTGLAFLQPIGAALRPHPDSRRRPIFNWLHWLVGNIAHILGIVTIFFATKLNRAKLPEWMDWILVAYVAFHVAVHLILSIASIASEKNNGKRVNTFPMKEMTSSRSPLHSAERKQDAPHSCFRKFMLALYLIIIILLVAALIIIAVFAPIEDNFAKFQNMIMQNQNSTGSK